MNEIADVEDLEQEEDFEILTTEWYPGTVQPYHFGMYEWIKTCKNFWEFPKRPTGMILWTKDGWLAKDGSPIDFNPEEDLWRGFTKPADELVNK
jgi:hypothetical protein